MKKVLLSGLFAVTFLLAGCPSFDVGGWIDSVNEEGKNTKATFGGSFSCTPIYDYFGNGDDFYYGVVEGYFQYHDHNFLIEWKGKERDMSFHGDFEQPIFIGQFEPEGLCEFMDDIFVGSYGAPDGYCGPARLQPSPRQPSDTGYGQDLAYRIYAAEDDEDEISVWIGPVSSSGNCPINKDNDGPDDGSECSEFDFCYHNHGILGGGNVSVHYPF